MSNLHIPITLLEYSSVKNNTTDKAHIVYFDDVTSLKVNNAVSKYWLPNFTNTAAGVRLDKYNKEYFNKWNGWIFVDLDHITNANETIVKLHKSLSEYTFYVASQVSASGNGIHIYFYVPVKFHCVEEFYAWDTLCYNIVFNNISSEYYDYHNFAHSQVFKISQYEWYINDNFCLSDTECEFDVSNDYVEYCNNVYKYVAEPEYISNKPFDRAKTEIDWYNNGGHSTLTEDEIDTLKPRTNFSADEINYTGAKHHLSHSNRYALICTLMYLYGNDRDVALDVYRKVIQAYQTTGKHSIDEYLNEHNNIDDRRKYEPSNSALSLLHKMGLKYDENIVRFHLNEYEYLGNILNDIIKLLPNGITLLQAPTGGGKTRAWIDYNKNIHNDILDILHRPILIIEPLNSIINTKYDDDVKVVTGNKQFPKEFNTYNMYVTNYNKLLRRTEAGTWEMRSDIEEFFSKFDLIVVDESHIIIKDAFRSDVLIPFIDSINKAKKKSKIVFQTATPMDECLLFNIDKKIIVTKKPERKCKYIFRQYNKDEKFHIQELTCLVKYYIEHNRKVYIYWNNGSLRQLESFKATYFNPDRVAIFHKRNTGNADMNYIATEHRLGDRYDVLLSSVYFGVGNDLDDECDAAVIIIGNNTWQEDIQAIGRWRNSKNVEVCQIVLPDEIPFLDLTANDENACNYNYEKYLDKYTKLWHDKYVKEKSIVIAKQAYQLKRESDIRPICVMQTAIEKYSSLCVKCNALSDAYYGIDVQSDYMKPLECDYEYTESIKAFNDSVKKIRDKVKRAIIAGTADWSEVNKDSKMEAFAKLYRQCKMYGVVDLIGVDAVANNYNQHPLELYIRYYKAIITDKVDYPELYGILWYRSKCFGCSEEKLCETEKWFGVDVEYRDRIAIIAYVVFNSGRNLDGSNKKLAINYFKEFKWNCENICKLDEKLAERLCSANDVSNYYMSATATFFNEYDSSKDNSEKYDSIDALTKKFETIDIDRRNTVEKCVKSLMRGRPTKEVTIDGVTYANMNEAAAKLGITRMTVYRKINEAKNKMLQK